MTKLVILTMTAAAVLVGASTAGAAVSPAGISPTKHAAFMNARIDHDRMNDLEWAGVVRSCLSPRIGVTAPADYDPRYCRAVLDVNFDDGDNIQLAG